MIRALTVLVVCGASALVSALQVGVEGLWGSLLGSFIVAVFFLLNPALLRPVTRAADGTTLPMSLLFFATKVMILLAVLTVATDPDGMGARIDATALTITMMIATVTWIVVLIWSAMTRRQLLYDLDD